jgi:hypothetical protein
MPALDRRLARQYFLLMATGAATGRQRRNRPDECLQEAAKSKPNPGPYKEERLNEESGKFETSSELKQDSGKAPVLNPSMQQNEKGKGYLLMNPVYTREYMESVVPKHRVPQCVRLHTISSSLRLHQRILIAYPDSDTVHRRRVRCTSCMPCDTPIWAL